jgi:uncharacterized membrane protein YoaK (UPF0700 family)
LNRAIGCAQFGIGFILPLAPERAGEPTLQPPTAGWLSRKRHIGPLSGGCANMLSAGAYSFRQKSRLAVSLSWIGGYTNVITLLFCGMTSSHMTGNVTHLGQAVAETKYAGACYFGWVIICFVSGAACSGALLEAARWHNLRSRYSLPLACEAILLSIFSLGLNVHLWRGHQMGGQAATMSQLTLYWMTGVAAMAMGLQNATITKVSGAVVRTTHLTGVSTDFGLEGAQLLMWFIEKTRARAGMERAERVMRVSRRHPSVQRLLVLAGIFWSFLLGVVVGALVEHYALWLAMVPPILFLGFIVIHEFLLPIAEVEQMDMLGDPELKGFGIDRSLLPLELGFYRLSHPAGRLHRKRFIAPYFSQWAERLPRKWRVIILAIGPQTRFDTNAFLDLETAVRSLRSQRRRLIICGMSPPQYRVLHHLGVTRVLEVEDLCPDLEFAVARGIELVRQITHDANAES